MITHFTKPAGSLVGRSPRTEIIRLADFQNQNPRMLINFKLRHFWIFQQLAAHELLEIIIFSNLKQRGK
jgi:hypothetical protein